MLPGQRLATCDEAELLVWDAQTGALTAIYGGEAPSEIVDYCTPRSGHWLATVHVSGGVIGMRMGNRGVLRIWDLKSGGPPRAVAEETRGLSGCELSPDERWLVTHHEGFKAYFWDTRTWELVGVIDGHVSPVIISTAHTYYAQDGSWFAMANDEGGIGLWDPSTQTLRHMLAGHSSRSLGYISMTAPADSHWLASTDGRDLRVWDTRDGSLIQTVKPARTGCAGLVADPAGHWVAACFGGDSLHVIPVTGRQSRGGLVSRGPRLAGGPRDRRWAATNIRSQVSDDGKSVLTVTTEEAHSGDLISSRFLVSRWDVAAGQRTAGPPFSWRPPSSPVGGSWRRPTPPTPRVGWARSPLPTASTPRP